MRLIDFFKKKNSPNTVTMFKDYSTAAKYNPNIDNRNYEHPYYKELEARKQHLSKQYSTAPLNIRPKTWDDIKGQNNVKDKLMIMTSACKNANEVMGHLLLTGPSGVGKTTIANVVATELEKNIVTIFAPRVVKINEIFDAIQTLNHGDILFIDEIHALPKKMQEALYDVLEDFVIYNANGNIKVNKFTFIGATNYEGKLYAALRRRLTTIKLSTYSIDELTDIINDNAIRVHNVYLMHDIAYKISKLSWGVPYRANELLKLVLDMAKSKISDRKITGDDITIELIEKMLKMENIDPLIGLNSLGRKYLIALTRNGGKACGINTLVSILGCTAETIETTIEPFLMNDVTLTTKNNGTLLGPLVEQSPRGRVATHIAMEYLNECRRAQKQKGWFLNENLSSDTIQTINIPQETNLIDF